MLRRSSPQRRRTVLTILRAGRACDPRQIDSNGVTRRPFGQNSTVTGATDSIRSKYSLSAQVPFGERQWSLHGTYGMVQVFCWWRCRQTHIQFVIFHIIVGSRPRLALSILHEILHFHLGRLQRRFGSVSGTVDQLPSSTVDSSESNTRRRMHL